MNTDSTYPKIRFPEFRDSRNWSTIRLGDCLLQAPDYGLNAPAVPYSDKLPTYIRITDIADNGTFLSNNKMSVDTELTDDNSLHEGDIVLARTGASVGKAYKYRTKDGQLIFAGFLIRIRPDQQKCISEYIYQYFFTPSFKEWVHITSARSGQPGINSKEYSSLLIPYTTILPEQQKIADCLSSLDDYIDKTKRKLEQLRVHKKGLIQQLFPTRGKTVPKLRFPEFQDTVEWTIKTLGMIGDTYGGLSGKSAEDFGAGKPYVTYKQVFDSLEIDTSACLQVQIEDNEKQNTLQYGDVLVTMSSETPEEVGYIAVVTNKNIPECYLNSFCFIYRLFNNESIDAKFLIYLFSSETYRSEVVRIAQGITRFNISKTKFKEIELAIPETKNEQRKIATALASIDKQLTEYDKKIKALGLHKKGLMQQLFPKL